MLRSLSRQALLCGSLLSSSFAAQAATMDFLDSHGGLLLGAGTYFHPLPHDNAFDPVAGLAPSGTTVSGTKKTYLLPGRIGIFREFGGGTFIELYGRLMLNRPQAWTASGDIAGSGTTSFRSYGGGVNLGASLFTRRRFRLQLALNAEYMLQKAKLDLKSNLGWEALNVNTTSMLAGIGLRPEVWLVDTWVLSIFAGYQYGIASSWSATEAAEFFGTTQSGLLQNSTDGGRVLAQFGGALVEATLRLSFY